MTQSFFGSWLKEHREAKELSQVDVAKFLGMSRGNYGHMESGRRKDVLTVEQAATICRIFGVEMSDLLRAEGFAIRTPAGIQNQEELAVLEKYRSLEPGERRFLLRGLGI